MGYLVNIDEDGVVVFIGVQWVIDIVWINIVLDYIFVFVVFWYYVKMCVIVIRLMNGYVVFFGCGEVLNQWQIYEYYVVLGDIEIVYYCGVFYFDGFVLE